MKINCLFRQLLLLLAFVVLCGNVFAQGTKERKKRERSPRDNSFWLNLNAGIGSTTSYDASTIPYSYTGFHDMEQVGFTAEWKRCHLQLLGSRFKTRYPFLDGTSRAYTADFEFLYSCLNPTVRRWHVWLGASTTNILEWKSIEDLQNAAITVSLFHKLNAKGLLQCDFAYEKTNPTHPWLSAFLSLSLPIYTAGSRPEFAYVMDPMNDVFDALFGANGPVFKWFPGCTTDLGFSLNLRNGNRIGLSYAWDYLTTGKKGYYRYDNAFHTVKLSFMFKI